jgi:hypothetical protein
LKAAPNAVIHEKLPVSRDARSYETLSSKDTEVKKPTKISSLFTSFPKKLETKRTSNGYHITGSHERNSFCGAQKVRVNNDNLKAEQENTFRRYSTCSNLDSIRARLAIFDINSLPVVPLQT